MGSAGESRKKIKMLMTFRTETGLRSPTAPIVLSQQSQNVLAESHDKHYETIFYEDKLPLSIEESELGSHDQYYELPISIEESGMGSHDQHYELLYSVEESGMGSHEQHYEVPLSIEESGMGSHDQHYELTLSIEEFGEM